VVAGERLVKFFRIIFRLQKPHKSFRRHSTVDDESSASLLRPTSSGSSSETVNDTADTKSSKPVPARPTLSEVFTNQSVINLIVNTFLALHSTCYDQLLPIFMHQDRQDSDSPDIHLPLKFSGGFGISPERIGTLFTLYGVMGCFIQFLVFPPVARKYGVLNCYKACALTFPIIYFATPFAVLIEEPLGQQAAMFGIMAVKCVTVIFAFPCSLILLTNSAVSLRILGTLNGISVSMSAVGRGFGPMITGAAFTWGLETGYVITAWWLLGIISIFGAIPVWYLIEMEGFSKTDATDDEFDSQSLLDEDAEDEEREIIAGDEVGFASFEDALDVVEGPSLYPVQSRAAGASVKDEGYSTDNRIPGLESRISSPIGLREAIGPGGGRRLSNGLAASNLGRGTGGTSLA
jgi:hypothetical protein